MINLEKIRKFHDWPPSCESQDSLVDLILMTIRTWLYNDDFFDIFGHVRMILMTIWTCFFYFNRFFIRTGPNKFSTTLLISGFISTEYQPRAVGCRWQNWPFSNWYYTDLNFFLNVFPIKPSSRFATFDPFTCILRVFEYFYYRQELVIIPSQFLISFIFVWYVFPALSHFSVIVALCRMN